jgi:hypothetical protein
MTKSLGIPRSVSLAANGGQGAPLDTQNPQPSESLSFFGRQKVVTKKVGK